MRGDLRQSSLAVLIRHLYAERKSGVLNVSRQKITKRLHFNKGVIIFADDGEATPFPSPKQAEDLLYSLFTWTSGEFAFEEGVPTIDDKMAFAAPPADLILEGNRAINDPEILLRLLGSEESVFACAQTTELPLFKTRLAPAESAVLQFARERARFKSADIPRVTSEASVLRALNALVSVGLLEIVEKGARPEPAPTPRPAAPPVAPPQPTAPQPTAPVAEAPLPVFEAEVAPAPEPPEPQTQPISEVEHLLNTYEAKRAGEAPPPPQQAPVAPAAPTPQRPAAAPPPPPPPRAQPQPQPPAPEPTSFARPVVEAPKVDVQADVDIEVEEPPRAPSPPPPSPPRATHAAPTKKPVPPWMTVIARAIPAIPQGKGRVVAAVSIGLVAFAVALVVWLTSGKDAPSETEAVVAAATAEMEPEPEITEPERVEPTGATEENPAPEPSEAELFYRANLAFERGDFEQSRAELAVLLERQPDFGAARELMAKIDRALEPSPPPKPKPSPPPRRRAARKAPEPKPEVVEVTPVAPPKPDPAAIFKEAQNAYAEEDLDTTQAKLDALREIDPYYPGAWKLREELSDKRWAQKTLPLAFSARHNHRLGGCDGVLTLTTRGIGYRSNDHDWFWNFANLATTDRRDAKHIQIDTRDNKTYRFDLRESVSGVDWTKFLELAK